MVWGLDKVFYFDKIGGEHGNDKNDFRKKKRLILCL